eukprot:14584827-Alexandrium_andersonii.AAC.1
MLEAISSSVGGTEAATEASGGSDSGCPRRAGTTTTESSPRAWVVMAKKSAKTLCFMQLQPQMAIE